MKKIYLLSVAVITLAFFFTFSSCKKTTHPTLPTPANNRLLSYTKASNTKGYAVNETYTFYYDGSNRLSSIIYATNDTNGGVVGENMVFTYSIDTTYKKITNVKTNKLVEIDTFVSNSKGQITTVIGGGANLSYQYYGKLLSGITQSYQDLFTVVKTNTTVSSTTTFTSDNADLLSSNFTGSLTASFSDVIPPLTVQWIDPFGITPTVTHSGVGGSTDVLNNYKGLPVYVTAKDAIGTIDTGVYPGGISLQVSYTVYPGIANTIGDYLQLNSFTTYGYNFYQNAHLVKSITSVTSVKNIAYTIDAYSRITQISVVNDSLGVQTTELYNLQYESY